MTTSPLKTEVGSNFCVADGDPLLVRTQDTPMWKLDTKHWPVQADRDWMALSLTNTKTVTRRNKAIRKIRQTVCACGCVGARLCMRACMCDTWQTGRHDQSPYCSRADLVLTVYVRLRNEFSELTLLSDTSFLQGSSATRGREKGPVLFSF